LVSNYKDTKTAVYCNKIDRLRNAPQQR